MKKTIVITGAGKRIGLYLTYRFLLDDYNVIALVRKNTDELNLLKLSYEKNLKIIEIDFLVKKINLSFWNNLNLKPNAFIHCASTFHYDTIETVTEKNIYEQEKVNCNVFIDACTSFYNYYKDILGPSSFIGFLDAKLEKLNKDHYSYTLSKLKLKSSLSFLAMTCAPKLTVNFISPGLTLKSGEQSEEDFFRSTKSLPFGYGTSIEQIYNTALFLTNQNTITGQNITVDAGQHLVSNRDIIFQ